MPEPMTVTRCFIVGAIFAVGERVLLTWLRRRRAVVVVVEEEEVERDEEEAEDIDAASERRGDVGGITNAGGRGWGGSRTAY